MASYVFDVVLHDNFTHYIKMIKKMFKKTKTGLIKNLRITNLNCVFLKNHNNK